MGAKVAVTNDIVNRPLYRFSSALFFLSFIAISRPTEASIIAWGTPVAGANSATAVGLPIQSLDATPDGVNNPTPNWIKYFIPLSGSSSGVYGATDVTPDGIPGCTTGVDCAGTFVDSGSGNSSLDMFLKFAPVAPPPLANARLTFEFADLDLKYVNDPAGFFESVQLFSATGAALSLPFTSAPGNGSGTYNGINWQLTRAAGTDGANYPVVLDFWGQPLTDLITNPFYAQLHFAVPSVASGTNTAEYLRAKLSTDSLTSVPEPGSLTLLGLGIAVCAMARSGRRPRPVFFAVRQTSL